MCAYKLITTYSAKLINHTCNYFLMNALNLMVQILPRLPTFSPNCIGASSLEALRYLAIIFAKCPIWCEFATNLFCPTFLLLLHALSYPWSTLSLDPSTALIGYIVVPCYDISLLNFYVLIACSIGIIIVKDITKLLACRARDQNHVTYSIFCNHFWYAWTQIACVTWTHYVFFRRRFGLPGASNLWVEDCSFGGGRWNRILWLTP